MDYIRTIFSQVFDFISRSLQTTSHFFRSLLYWFVAKIAGAERADKLVSQLTDIRTRLSNYYESKIDRDSKYFQAISRIWKVSLYTFLAGLFYLFCVSTNFLWLMGSMPSVEDLQNPKVAQSSEIYTADGIMIRKFYTENRTPVTFDQISPNLVEALIATEDVRFNQHSGVDLKAMAGVVMGIATGGTERGGGSTITQQLAKKLFKTRKRNSHGLLGTVPGLRTVIYKTKEWLTAINLERNFTKDEILMMYFNTVDYGNNTYGIKTAAKTYFSKSPDSLSVQEAAVLVGLQKATTTYNPIRNPKRSLERRNVVLNQMAKYGYLTKRETDSISRLPLELHVSFETPRDEDNSNYFTNAIVKYLEKWGDENDYDLYTDGLKVYTTIDSRAQAYAEKSVTEKMRQLQRVFDEHWRNRNPWVDEKGNEIPNFLQDVMRRTPRYASLIKRYPARPDSVDYYLNKKDTMTVYDWKTGGKMRVNWSPMDSLAYYKHILRAGMMAMNPYTGQIKAWVGGLDYEFFKYDHVRQGRRQPGSTFKPFVYTAAIDDSISNMTPCDQIQDKPFSKEYSENGERKSWSPKNSNGYFTYSNMTLRRALAQSVNSVTAQLTDMVGSAQVVKYAKKLGITSKLEAVPSIGLGPFDVSLYDMVAAYGCFVNGGVYTEPILVTRIEDRMGQVIAEFAPEHHQAIKPESAFLMVHMLKGGVEEPGGTSQGIRAYNVMVNGNEIGGKTGTTSNNSDGWYMCITRDLVVGAWVGGDDRSIHFRTTGLGEGAKTALPIVGNFLQMVYKDKSIGIEPGPFSKPTFAINKEYNCTHFEAPADTTSSESDSVSIQPDEDFDFNSIAPPPLPGQTAPDTTKKKNP